MQQDDLRELRDDLIQQLRAGRVVAIVGAGVSMGATNRATCASWTGLLHHGVNRCVPVASSLPKGWAERVHAEIDSGDLDDLLSAAEKITQKLGGRSSAEYRRWLAESVGALTIADPALIQALQQSGVALATTNYDSLLEQVTGLEPVTWQDDADAVAVVRGEKSGVLHLHGYWRKPESVVLGIRSYEDILGSELAQTLLHVLQTAKTVLFIGCGEGLADPNFGALLDWTAQVLGQATHRHFRLCLDGELAELKQKHPPEGRLFPLPYGPQHADLLPFLKSLLAAAGTAPKPAPPRTPARPTLNLAAYAKAVRDRYAKLKLEAMDATGSYYRELELWRVFIPQNVRECQEYLPQVLELPKEQLCRLRESGQWEGEEVDADELTERRRSYLEQSPRNVLELVDDPGLSHLVLLGDPGSGKSSLLQTLAVQWADTGEARRADLDLPLLVELRAYGQAHARGQTGDILPFIEHGHGIPCRLDGTALLAKLEAGRVRVCFDGLDEVFDPALREQMINAIQRFANDFPRVRIIVTSRVIGYKGESFRGAGFRHFMLQELDDDQVAEFLTRWHRDTYRDTEKVERDEKHARLKRSIEDSLAIRELVGNPLLLTMAAILNRYRDLPRDRAELYEECAKLLLQQWKVEEALRADEELRQDALAIGLREKQSILRRLAREMQTGADGALGNLIDERRLEAVIEETVRPLVQGNPLAVARALIRHLRERNFILCFAGGDSYAFVHRTFLEYFCADDFRVSFDYEKSIDAAFLTAELYGRHWADESWHEVLSLLAGMIHPSTLGGILDFLLARPDPELTCQHIFLAARCVGEVRDLGGFKQTSRQVLEQLKALTQFELPYIYDDLDEEGERATKIRSEAATLAGRVWGGLPEVMHWLKSTADQFEDFDLSEAALKALARGWKDDPETLPWLEARARTTEAEFRCRSAMAVLARGWKNDPQILLLVKSCAQAEKTEWVREAAVEALALGWKDDPETLPWLKAHTLSDKHEHVREAAVGALAQGWKDDPETLRIVKACAQSEGSDWVRLRAVEALVQGWKDDPETLRIVKACAVSDKNSGIRPVVLHMLARGWKDDPETLRIVKACAVSDKHSAVRQTALEALAQGWKDDPQTLHIVKTCAQSDEDGNVGQAAVAALVKGWKDNPETLIIVKARAHSDKCGKARKAAVEALASEWKDDPETLPILKARAQSDADSDVRQVALAALARGWKDDPQTLPLVKAAAQLDRNSEMRLTALAALVREWKDDPQTLPILKASAKSDKDSDVRAAAVVGLARGWSNDPQTLPWLQNRIRSEQHEEVREMMVGRLARGWREQQKDFVWLKTHAESDRDFAIRWGALEALTVWWKDNPETLPIVTALAERDKAASVRRSAVKALAWWWKENLGTLLVVRTRAKSDRAWSVRKAAVEALARNWKRDPGTLPFIKARAKSDADADVQWAAVSEIARMWRGHPETLPWLKTRVRSARKVAVRCASLQAMAQWWREDAETLAIVETCARSEKQALMRLSAVSALAQGWKDAPETLTILKACAQSDEDNEVRQAAVQELARGWEDDPEVQKFLRDLKQGGPQAAENSA